MVSVANTQFKDEEEEMRESRGYREVKLRCFGMAADNPQFQRVSVWQGVNETQKSYKLDL